MRFFQAALLTATLIGSASAANAQPVEGVYVGAGAELNFLQDQSGTVDAIPAPTGIGLPSQPAKLRWGGGYAVSGSVGYGVGNGLRLEAEASYRNEQQGHGGSGQQQQFGLMGNLLYDFDVGLPWMSPYVGVGAGYQDVAWSRVTVPAQGTAGSSTVTAGGTLGGFAYQAIAGVSFPISSVPGLSITAEYRFLDVTGSRSYHAQASVPAGAAPAATATHLRVSDSANHSVMLGLRYAFGAQEAELAARPPPAEPIVPAPGSAAPAASAAVRTYLVFFDWDKADLSPRARDVIAEAVRNSAHISYTRIEVAGHADLSGLPRNNQALSLRRARAVAAELERWGVQPASIELHAYGATKPLVPTAAGVQQQENRRVEIVYR